MVAITTTAHDLVDAAKTAAEAFDDAHPGETPPWREMERVSAWVAPGVDWPLYRAVFASELRRLRAHTRWVYVLCDDGRELLVVSGTWPEMPAAALQAMCAEKGWDAGAYELEERLGTRLYVRLRIGGS